MKILGIGVDIIQNSRIKNAIKKKSFINKIFSKVGFNFKHGSSYIPQINSDKSNSYWYRFKKFLKINFFIEELYLIKNSDI